jgi:hypothetical protein
MSTTGLHLRQRLCAALVAASGVSPEPGHTLEDVIPVLVYRDRAGQTHIEIGPRSVLSLRQVKAILTDAADSIRSAP